MENPELFFDQLDKRTVKLSNKSSTTTLEKIGRKRSKSIAGFIPNFRIKQQEKVKAKKKLRKFLGFQKKNTKKKSSKKFLIVDQILSKNSKSGKVRSYNKCKMTKSISGLLGKKPKTKISNKRRDSLGLYSFVIPKPSTKIDEGQLRSDMKPNVLTLDQTTKSTKITLNRFQSPTNSNQNFLSPGYSLITIQDKNENLKKKIPLRKIFAKKKRRRAMSMVELKNTRARLKKKQSHDVDFLIENIEKGWKRRLEFQRLKRKEKTKMKLDDMEIGKNSKKDIRRFETVYNEVFVDKSSKIHNRMSMLNSSTNNLFKFDGKRMKKKTEIETISDELNRSIMKQELVKTLRQSTEDARRSQNLKRETREFLCKKGIHKPSNGLLSLASITNIKEYALKKNIDSTLYVQSNFEKALTKEKQGREEEVFYSVFSEENIMLAEIIKMMRIKEYKSDLRDSFDEGKTLDYDKAIDYIYKTRTLTKAFTILQKSKRDRYIYMKKMCLILQKKNPRIARELLYCTKANLTKKAEVILNVHPELILWEDKVIKVV